MSDQEDKERPTRTVMLYGARARRRDKQEWDMRPIEVSHLGALKISLVNQDGADVAAGVTGPTGATGPTGPAGPAGASGTMNFAAGSGTGLFSTIGKLNAQFNTIDTTTPMHDLHSYTLPANSLNATGRVVRVKWWGSVNSTSSTYNFVFGNVSITAANAASLVGLWSAELLVFRTGASAQFLFFNFIFVPTPAPNASGVTNALLAAPLVSIATNVGGVVDTADIIIKSRGDTVAGTGNLELGMVVEFFN